MRHAWTVVLLACALCLAVNPAQGDDAGPEDGWWRLFEQATTLQEARKYDDAMAAYGEAESFAVEKRLDPNYVKASIAGRIECLHACYDYLGLRNTSLHMLEVARATDLAEDVFDTLLDLGYFEMQLGDTHQALIYLEEARSMVGDKPELAADVHLRVALTQRARGQYAAALEAGELARRYFRESGDLGNLASALQILGETYVRLGEYERGRECIEKGLRLVGEEDAVLRADLLTSLGSLASREGEGAQAREAFDAACTLFEKAGEKLATANVIYLDAMERSRDGEHEQALAQFEEARGLAGIHASLYLSIERAIGSSLLRLERYDAGLERLQACHREADARGDLGEVAHAAALLAVEHQRRGRTEKAWQLMRESLDALAQMTTGLSPLNRASTRAHHAYPLALAGRIAFDLVDPAPCLDLLDRTRAATLTAGIGRTVAAPTPADPELESARERVAAALCRRQAASEDGAFTLVVPAEKEYREARVAYLDQLGRRQRASPGAMLRGGRGGADAFPLAIVQKELLGPEDALVLYSVVGDDLRAFVIEKTTTRKPTLGGIEEIGSLIQEVRDAMGKAGDLPAADPLSTALIGRLELPDSVTRLLVSPVDVLAAVPFSWIAGEREVVFVPSATAYGLLQEVGQARGEGVLAVADPVYAGVVGGLVPGARGTSLSPLEYTREEALAITRKTDVRLLGPDATEGAFGRALPSRERWRSVHFACHGLLDEKQPAWSSLALTPGERDDGFLSVIEILGMRIPTDLAVLSACDTGLGKTLAGEGLTGLASAFLYAGAPRVVASLWKVDDEATQAFMKKFYEAFNPEEPADAVGAAEALRAAQDHLRKTEKWSHPHYWAAWVLWGLPD